MSAFKVGEPVDGVGDGVGWFFESQLVDEGFDERVDLPDDVVVDFLVVFFHRRKGNGIII